jgi:hypothetical protein
MPRALNYIKHMNVCVYVNLICKTYSTTSEDTSKHYYYHCISVTIYPVVGTHHSCQLHTKFCPTPALKVNSICRGNYGGSSMWIPTQ